jgi:hypothetical protein
VIAEPTASTPDDLHTEASPEAHSRTLSLSGVVRTLQILLATRRAARNAAHAEWPSLAGEA